MKISIIIPAYNEEKNISKVIKSISKQKSKSVEIIVVDNNSTDSTYLLAKKLADKVYRCKEQGISPARNYGAKKAIGEILVFIDADCLAYPKWVTAITEGFKDKNISVMSGIALYNNKNILKRSIINFASYIFYICLKLTSILGMPYVMAPNIAIRKDIFNKVGGFDKVIGEDAHLSVKLRKIKNIKSKVDARMKVMCSARRIEKEGMIKLGLIWLIARFKKINSDDYKLHDKI